MNCELTYTQVTELVQKYGSPLYVFHSDEFRKNYQKLLASIRAYYHKYNIAYSYKTNYTPAICKIVKELGGVAEVVSDMEYRLAKKLGYSDKEIVYNGPVKGNGLFEHLLNGGVTNIDSLDELESVVRFAEKHKEKDFSIAFRVNIDIGQGFISRFGLDAYADVRDCELNKAFKYARSASNIKVVGLHCHVGRSRSIEAWENRVRIMFSLIDRCFDTPPLFIDFGSGMNSVMEPSLAKQFGGDIPTFEEYAKVVGKTMKDRYGMLPRNLQPILYTEPGTTLISGCMSFLGRVESIKNVKGKDYVTFNCCGGNMGDICHLKNLPINIYSMRAKSRKVSNAAFVGYTCLEHDHIYEGFSGELAVGDIVQFRNVGSYSNVFKPPFILPNCAMVQVDNLGDVSLIKEAEDFDDIFHTYIF